MTGKPPLIGEHFVKMPQEIWDQNLDFTLGEFRLLGYLLRHQRRAKNDRVLVTQDELLNGRKRQDGTRMDQGCGLSSARHIIAARTKLEERGWLRVFKEAETYNASLVYEALARDFDDEDGVQREPSDGSQRESLLFPKGTILVAEGNHCNKEVEVPEVPEPRKRKAFLPFGEGLAKLTKDEWELEKLPKIWTFFNERTDRNGTYASTPLRIKMGLERLRDAVEFCNGDKTKALKLFKLAIDNLADDEFLAGKNDREKKYQEWDDHLCKDWKTFEKRFRGNEGRKS